MPVSNSGLKEDLSEHGGNRSVDSAVIAYLSAGFAYLQVFGCQRQVAVHQGSCNCQQAAALPERRERRLDLLTPAFDGLCLQSRRHR